MSLVDAPIVARVVRQGFVESLHRGLAVITAPDGSVERAWGDPATPVFPRSSLKPLQAIASLRSGAPLRDQALALACASHSGEAWQMAGVRASLAASGLTVDALGNTPGQPIGEHALQVWLAAGYGEERIAQNCSGKHAGFLRACVASGWSLGDYLDPAHPLQEAVVQVIADYADEPIVATAVDGCGAPVHAFALTGLARAFGRMAAAQEGEAEAVAHAMHSFPFYVGGPRRPDSELMAAVPGVIAKEGAEAVFAVGLPDGRGVAVKIADGSRAGRVVAAAALRYCDVDPRALDKLGDIPVLGHGERVGAVEATLD
ncbi:asparaginase [Propioniciclava flava]|uniref:asparaginase n=1 Tax=Propioniciclava flava TaxID=2072026 RepID=UPI001F4F7971|nr:asparaginase [Propioniciclava flava]